MPLHSSLLGLSETELCDMVCSLVPDWRGDALEDFDFLSGGYSNANVVFTHRGAERSARYVLRIPMRAQPYVNRVAEAAWYKRLPASVGIRPIALDVPTGLMVTAWVDGELLVDVFADRFSESDLLAYLHSLHSALPAVAERYCVPTLLPAFAEPDAQSQTLLGSLPPALTATAAAGAEHHLPQRSEPVEHSGHPAWLGDLGLGICGAKRWPIRFGQPAPRIRA